MERPIRNELELGARLRAARTAQGLTQAEVATRAGVSRGFVTELERGMRPRAELTRVFAVMAALDLAMTAVEYRQPSFDDALAALLAQDES